MSTVKDGVKLAAGWLLFRFIILPLVSLFLCVAVCGIYAATKDGPLATPVTSPPNAPKPSTGQWVTFSSPCNLRYSPKASSALVGVAVVGVRYRVVDTKGGWRQISFNGDNVWAGCRGN